jgi:HTH-type transcriptional regulator/antitoxin HigA
MTKELERIAALWPTFRDVLSTPHTEREYLRVRAVLDRLTDEVGDDEGHPLASLMETVGNLVSAYEAEDYAEPQEDPIGVLKYLMQEHGLRQTDMQELGSQGVVSEILAGKRALNLRQVRALGARFSISPAVFIASPRQKRGTRVSTRKRPHSVA